MIVSLFNFWISFKILNFKIWFYFLECTNPNHAPTQCWKSFGKGAFKCTETQNPIDCGFFCASSPVHCAKTTLGIINVITSIASSFVKDPAKAANTVGKTQQELNAFNQKFSFSKLISVLKEVNGYPNSFTKGNSIESVDYFVTNLKAFFDALNGIQAESKSYISLIYYNNLNLIL